MAFGALSRVTNRFQWQWQYQKRRLAIVSRAVKDTVTLDAQSFLDQIFKRTSGDRALDIYLPQTVGENLIHALHDKTLHLLYGDMANLLTWDEKLSNFSAAQIHVATQRCMNDWLIEVESAISDWQHSGANTERRSNIPFLFKFGIWRVVINLDDLATLRKFLTEQLEIPMNGRRLRPEYVRMLGPKN